MASFTVQNLVDRAKVYVDDDHTAQTSWLSNPGWLAIANAEYAQLYGKWIRGGLMQPLFTQETFSEGEYELDEAAIVVVGVARDNGGSLTMLSQAQAVVGRDAFWRSATEPTGVPMRWSATGAGDLVTITLDPLPSSATDEYIVRYIQAPVAFTAMDDELEVPYGADERLVLGMARRAHLKDSGSSQLLERLIVEADGELQFSAMGKANGPRVMSRRANPYSTPTPGRWPERHSWRYI